MSTISLVIFAVVISFLFYSTRRLLQLVYWNMTLFGYRETLSDLKMLYKLYVTIAMFVSSVPKQFQEAVIDLSNDGINILYEHNDDGHANISVNCYRLIPDHGVSTIIKNICIAMAGDDHWIRQAKHTPMAVLTIRDRVDRIVFGIIPIVIVYNQIIKQHQDHNDGNKIKDATNAMGFYRNGAYVPLHPGDHTGVGTFPPGNTHAH